MYWKQYFPWEWNCIVKCHCSRNKQYDAKMDTTQALCWQKMSVTLLIIILLTNIALLAAIPQIVHYFVLNKDKTLFWITTYPCNPYPARPNWAGGAHYQCFTTDVVTAEMLLHYKKQLLDFPKYFNYSQANWRKINLLDHRLCLTWYEILWFLYCAS